MPTKIIPQDKKAEPKIIKVRNANKFCMKVLDTENDLIVELAQMPSQTWGIKLECQGVVKPQYAKDYIRLISIAIREAEKNNENKY